MNKFFDIIIERNGYFNPQVLLLMKILRQDFVTKMWHQGVEYKLSEIALLNNTICKIIRVPIKQNNVFTLKLKIESYIQTFSDDVDPLLFENHKVSLSNFYLKTNDNEDRHNDWKLSVTKSFVIVGELSALDAYNQIKSVNFVDFIQYTQHLLDKSIIELDFESK